MPNFTEITQTLSSEIDKLNIFLKEATNTNVPLINTLSKHMIESGGKRIRPIVLILLSRILGNEKNVIECSAILELIHGATLLHDDVVDQSILRHNIKTANNLWGNESAVLVGDFLYSRAFELIVEINRENIYKILAETTNKISQGEVMQLMSKNQIIDNEDQYLNVIYLKTAKLFEASALIAIDLAESDFTKNAENFGKNFGIAYQLRNDYLDYFGDQEKTGKNISEDLSEGKSTLPLIHSYNKSDNNDKMEISRIFNGKIISESHKLLEIFIKNKSDIYIQEKINYYTNKAIESLEVFEGEDKKTLIDLTKYCSSRTK
tara:strand:+ start:3051 stop:4010 length:960 start_codon:yes stop_codon:yes gene_type:complete